MDRSPTPPDEHAPGVIQENIEESTVVPSPSAEHFEPDPDSFLIDDPEDPVSDDENVTPLPSSQELSEQSMVPPAEEISLSQPHSGEYSSPLLSSNVYKAVPPPSPPDSDEDDETPELYLPGLVIPTMFLPIPNVRFLST